MKLKVTIYLAEGGEWRLSEAQVLSQLNPKEYLLYGTALCAGKTLQALLTKERVKAKSIEIAMSGHIDTEKVEGRSQFIAFNIAYDIECYHIAEQSKVGHAVTLTNEKYCGNLAMLRKVAPISHEVAIVSTESVEA